MAEIFPGSSKEPSAARLVITALPLLPWYSVFHVPMSFGLYARSFSVKMVQGVEATA